MNIYDIASKAGVSIATVSRVLNGKGNVSEKTKEHVLKIIEEMGYTPNIFARGLGLNSIKMVGILCSDVSDIYYATAVSTLEKELRRGGYDSLLCCTGDNIEVRINSLSPIEPTTPFVNVSVPVPVDATLLIKYSVRHTAI